MAAADDAKKRVAKALASNKKKAERIKEAGVPAGQEGYIQSGSEKIVADQEAAKSRKESIKYGNWN
jgi:folate-dependent tRNA-U54 methylase TrmFO/GidA